MPLAGSGLLRLTTASADQRPDWQPCATCSADQTFVPPAPPPAPAKPGGNGGGAPGVNGRGTSDSPAGDSAGGAGGGSAGSAARVVTPRIRLIARVVSVRSANVVRVRVSDSRQVFDVHLIGIDVPKANECGGSQSRAALRKLVRRGLRVHVTTDTRVAALDSSGRVNAYLTLASGKRVELAQVTAGWAKAKRGTYLMARRHKAAQTKAKKAKRGVWKRCGGKFHTKRR
jgi:endonuclease YncB( thermonuclease family)